MGLGSFIMAFIQFLGALVLDYTIFNWGFAFADAFILDTTLKMVCYAGMLAIMLLATLVVPYMTLTTE